MMDIVFGVGETICLAVSFHAFLRCQKDQSSLQDLIAFVQKAAILTPTTAFGLLESARDPVSQDIRITAEGKNYIKGLGLFQGIANCTRPLYSLMDLSTKLLVSEISLDKLISNPSQSEELVETPKNPQVLKVQEFTLSDPSDLRKQLMVDSIKLHNYQDALDIIKMEEHSRSLTVLEHLVGWLVFSLRLFFSVTNFGKKSSNFNIGTRRVERGILVGQLLTVFGEFIFNKMTKSLTLVNPIYLMKNKEQLIKHLLDKNTRQGRNKGLLIALSAYFAFRVVKRGFKILKFLWSKYQTHFRRYRLDEFYRVKQINTTGFLCVNCKSRPRCVIFRPCLHLLVCWACDAKRGGQGCPECQREVETSVHIYTA